MEGVGVSAAPIWAFWLGWWLKRWEIQLHISAAWLRVEVCTPRHSRWVANGTAFRIRVCNSLLAVLDMFAVTSRFQAQGGSVVWGIKSQIRQRSKVVRCLPWLGPGSEAAVICLRPLFVHRAALWDSTIAPARSRCPFLLSPWHIPGTVRFRRVSMG